MKGFFFFKLMFFKDLINGSGCMKANVVMI